MKRQSEKLLRFFEEQRLYPIKVLQHANGTVSML